MADGRTRFESYVLSISQPRQRSYGLVCHSLSSPSHSREHLDTIYKNLASMIWSNKNKISD